MSDCRYRESEVRLLPMHSLWCASWGLVVVLALKMFVLHHQKSQVTIEVGTRVLGGGLVMGAIEGTRRPLDTCGWK